MIQPPPTPACPGRNACAWPTVCVLAALSAALLAAAGCTSTPAGIEGRDAFTQEAIRRTVAGVRPAAEAARCFEETARFLPLSEFSRDSVAGDLTYRLRVHSLWFEEVRISATAQGSQAELRIAPNLNTRWMEQFQKDRMDPLEACLNG